MTRRIFLPAAAGVIVGALVAIGLGRFTAPAAASGTKSPKPTLANGSGTVPAFELERRLQKLEQDAAKASKPAASAAPTASSAPARERRHFDAKETFARRLAEVEREPIDRQWAANAELAFDRSLRARLAGVEGQPAVTANIVRIRCHSTSCTAEFEWSSFEVARGEWSQIMHTDYELSCAREIVLPEPEAAAPAGGAYRATMIYDCESSRAQENSDT
jgi:hypothetical protein